MPGWHADTIKYQQSGSLKLVGIVQEQHADRARLFMQWKQMDWPLMFDPQNLLGVEAVPITLLIDERGVVHKRNPSREDFEDFVSERELAAVQHEPLKHPDIDGARRLATTEETSQALPAADVLALWGDGDDLDSAIEMYERHLEEPPDDAVAHFRTGVAYRKRHDSDSRRDGDFSKASEHWTRALSLNPNQYIWRRRIQQYGPRLQKPYAFFDWVEQARTEIRERGETPVELRVEPGGAELATPTKQMDVTVSPLEPDPGGRILRDGEGLIRSEVTLVPAVATPGGSVRVHVQLAPSQLKRAHWNNEVEGLVFWADAEDGVVLDQSFQQLGLPSEPTSLESRTVELEVSIPDNATDNVTLNAYAIYYVCEDVDGQCLYRRLDMPITIPVSE